MQNNHYLHAFSRDLEDSGNLSYLLQTTHKRLILLRFLHIIISLQTYPNASIST